MSWGAFDFPEMPFGVQFFVWVCDFFVLVCLFVLEKGREGEKQQCVVASRAPPTGPVTQACALTGNRTGKPSVPQAGTPARAGVRFLIIRPS